MAARVDAPYAALKAARNATEDAEELSTDAFARLTLVDFELDEACRLAELDALGAVGKDRKRSSTAVVSERSRSATWSRCAAPSRRPR